MNPLLLLIVFLIFSSGGKSNLKSKPYINIPSIQKSFLSPFSISYFDTFKMELLLDRLRAITDALDKINHLNQMRTLPPSKENSINRIQESLDAAKGFLVDTKAEKKIDTLSNTISGVKQFQNMEGLLSNLGPILSMLNNNENDN
ncbi:hypothetical protein [Sinanaerobacter sp. ZZT-01]|uniref:hypothetical protein n=1 Tax=Sinanaerobacter sp. ZZT-01 TaxID=3111540 RepID=UPI002D774697|nr:hypothetical protein [Sinanaerobacter sp. ZZT-01]WRR92135.1 hypothetical protein U5921_08610 [Sinanaerobacter sp. ZZT-01]